MVQPVLLAKADQEIYILQQMSNRHGLVAGATGTGAESLSQSRGVKPGAGAGSSVGPQIIRGVLGGTLGASTSRRRY